MPSLPVVACISSQECPGCFLFRGVDGKLTPFASAEEETSSGHPKPPYDKSWSEPVFSAILLGSDTPLTLEKSAKLAPSGQVCRLFDIHYADLQATRVAQVSEYVILPDGRVRQHGYTGAVVPPPAAMITYAVKYPAWILFPGNEWDRAVRMRPGSRAPGSILAFVYGKFTERAGYDEFAQPIYRTVYAPNPVRNLLEEAAAFSKSPESYQAISGDSYIAPPDDPRIVRWRLGGFGSATMPNFGVTIG